MPHDDLVQCLEKKLAENKNPIERLLKALMNMGIDPPWMSFEWQKTKYLIARSIAYCLCRHGCRVYLLEMHGGEPSEGIGDKDIDLAVGCPLSPEKVEGLEKSFEEKVNEFLSSILGGNAREKLKVPNIVELHSISEFLIKKHVEARDQRYAIDLC